MAAGRQVPLGTLALQDCAAAYLAGDDVVDRPKLLLHPGHYRRVMSRGTRAAGRAGGLRTTRNPRRRPKPAASALRLDRLGLLAGLLHDLLRDVPGNLLVAGEIHGV